MNNFSKWDVFFVGGEVFRLPDILCRTSETDRGRARKNRMNSRQIKMRIPENQRESSETEFFVFLRGKRFFVFHLQTEEDWHIIKIKEALIKL